MRPVNTIISSSVNEIGWSWSRLKLSSSPQSTMIFTDIRILIITASRSHRTCQEWWLCVGSSWSTSPLFSTGNYHLDDLLSFMKVATWSPVFFAIATLSVVPSLCASNIAESFLMQCLFMFQNFWRQFSTIKMGIGPICTKTWNSKISPAWLWLQSFKPKADPQGLKYLSLDQDSHLNLKKMIVRWVVNVFLCSNQQHLMHSSWSCQWFSLVWGERPWELGCQGGRTGRTWWMIQEKFNSRYCRNPVWYQDSLEQLNSISERDKFCCKSKNTCHHGQSTPRWCWEATRHHHPRRPPPWSLTTKPKDFWLCQFPISFMLQTGVYVPRVLISPQHFRKKTMPIWYRAYLLLLAWPCVLIFQHSMLLTKLDIMWQACFC